MSPGTLILRGLRHYWRTNLAVIAGVAVAVSVLAGALLVGESVRASLRGLVDERLGRTAVAVTGQGFFRQTLADEIKKGHGFSTQFADAASLVVIEASVTHESSGREASRVQVYGVDAAFFRLHGVGGVEAPTGRQALVSPGLAAELGAAAGDGLLLRVQKPSAIPADSLAGRRSDTSRAVRLTTRETLRARPDGRVHAAAAAGGRTSCLRAHRAAAARPGPGGTSQCAAPLGCQTGRLPMVPQPSDC